MRKIYKSNISVSVTVLLTNFQNRYLNIGLQTQIFIYSIYIFYLDVIREILIEYWIV